MRRPTLKPLPPAPMQVPLEIGAIARLLPMNDLMQHLVPPAVGLVRVRIHGVADDAGTHLHHGVVGGAGGVVSGVAGEGVFLLVVVPERGFGVEGRGALVVHVDDEVGVALEDGMIEYVCGVDFGFDVFFESVICANIGLVADRRWIV